MKRTYENLSIKIVNVAVKDVITTSGFDGFDQEFGIPTNPSSATLPDDMA